MAKRSPPIVRHAERPALAYLDAAMAVAPRVAGHVTPKSYRLASLVLQAGIIDRTGTLEHGFEPIVVDPIPTAGAAPPSLSDLCDERGAEIVRGAYELRVPVRVFWSGRVSSTAALIGILKTFETTQGEVEVVLSERSIATYRRFYNTVVKAVPHRVVAHPGTALRPDAINVTGACGDLLFGSVRVFELPLDRVMGEWEANLAHLLRQPFRFGRRAERVMDYLRPLVLRCPHPVATLFEALWWLGFALTWNAASFRMLAATPPGDWAELAPSMAPFYRTDGFQRWALANPHKRVGTTLESFQWPLKDYIRDFTRDDAYHRSQSQGPCPEGTLWPERRRQPMAIDARMRPYTQPFDTSERPRLRTRAEGRLWRELRAGP